MSDYLLNIIEFLEKSLFLPVIDVRSPAEFEHGHIPGAVNLPLFTNEERSIVGTLYLQKGSSEAMMKGLELIGPKMKAFADLAMSIAPEREALLYCWRGGMRSNSMAWLMNTIGIRTSTLEGGYKSYRRYVLEFFEKPFKLIVIGGMTGSGKTDVLEMLEMKGKQVIHLERLARHKGSVFGGAGMPEQPSNEQFENDLFACLRVLDVRHPVYIEDESLSIGRVFIPRSFYTQMSAACSLNLIVPLGRRVQCLIAAYTEGDNESLVAGVKRIEKRLGRENTTRIIDCIQQGELETAVKMVIRYYDKVYARSMARNSQKEVTEVIVSNEDVNEIANKIIVLTNNLVST